MLFLLLNYNKLNENYTNNDLLAYCIKNSYEEDEFIDIKIKSILKDIKINIYTINNKLVYTKNFISKNQNLKNNPDIFKFANGFKWGNSISFKPNLKPNYYTIELIQKENKYYIPLIIKNKKRKNDNLLLLNTNTWNAYNHDGGASYYRYNINEKKYNRNSPGGGSYIISFDRTNNVINKQIHSFIKNEDIKSHLIYQELIFLNNNNYNIDIITDLDLHNNYPVNNYKNVILVCHPEYWTTDIFNNINKENNIISLGGNVGYRQVEYNKDFTKMKYINIFEKEKLINITGSYYNSKGYNTYYPYKILKPENFVFKNVNSKITNNKDISGHETDKCIIDKKYIIAKGLNEKNGGADMLLFNVKNKKRFSTGSITFCRYINNNNDNGKIVKNVLNYFLE